MHVFNLETVQSVVSEPLGGSLVTFKRQKLMMRRRNGWYAVTASVITTTDYREKNLNHIVIIM